MSGEIEFNCVGIELGGTKSGRSIEDVSVEAMGSLQAGRNMIAAKREIQRIPG